MKKLVVFSILLSFLIVFSPWLKPQLASYLLTSELSSDKKISQIISQKGQPLNPSAKAIFNNQEVTYSLSLADLLAQISEIESGNFQDDNILGTNNERWIEVNLSQQRVYGWEGGNQVYNFLVSTGKWASTPTGNFRIWIKLAKTTMSGGSKALGTYYYLPNVPCTMYFYKGYGLHGTYWHNNFGQPMSHGCVNMRTEDACALFAWASVGTRVNIHY